MATSRILHFCFLLRVFFFFYLSFTVLRMQFSTWLFFNNVSRFQNVTTFSMERFQRTHEIITTLECLLGFALSIFSFFLKGKQLTWRHWSGTTKPQQGEGKSLESPAGVWDLVPSPLLVRWQTMCIGMATRDTRSFHNAALSRESPHKK